MSESKGIVRYSDAQLEEFKVLIEDKMRKAEEQLKTLQEQIWEVTENSSDEHGGDWMDDSSINSEVEMLNTMAIRQRKYIKDLDNALIRIRNNTYGICVITGELIEKRRLLAVPTTTKSVMAKNEEKRIADEKSTTSLSKMLFVKKVTTPKIISKVIKKSGIAPKSVVKDEEEEYLDFDMDIDDDTLPNIEFDDLEDDNLSDEEEEDFSIEEEEDMEDEQEL